MKATCLDGDASKKGMNGIDWANKCGDIRPSREKKKWNQALKVGGHD